MSSTSAASKETAKAKTGKAKGGKASADGATKKRKSSGKAAEGATKRQKTSSGGKAPAAKKKAVTKKTVEKRAGARSASKSGSRAGSRASSTASSRAATPSAGKKRGPKPKAKDVAGASASVVAPMEGVVSTSEVVKAPKAPKTPLTAEEKLARKAARKPAVHDGPFYGGNNLKRVMVKVETTFCPAQISRIIRSVAQKVLPADRRIRFQHFTIPMMQQAGEAHLGHRVMSAGDVMPSAKSCKTLHEKYLEQSLRVEMRAQGITKLPRAEVTALKVRAAPKNGGNKGKRVGQRVGQRTQNPIPSPSPSTPAIVAPRTA